jgi:hypothetical protein
VDWFHVSSRGVLGCDNTTLRLETTLPSKSQNSQWIHVAQDRDQCRALVNAAVNLCIP